MRRRDFISLIGGAALAAPLSARAQQGAMPVVGYLTLAAPEGNIGVTAFLKGLSETGYVEGRNVTIEYRWAHNEPDRLRELAADLVRRRVAVIATPGSTDAALAAKAATTIIPIVFSTAGDPVQLGLVASFNRPGGNLTGISFMTVELGAKQFGLLRELLPHATRFAVLVNPNQAVSSAFTREVQAAVASVGGHLEIFTARDNREISAAFASLAQKQVEGLVVGSAALFTSRRMQLATLATRHAVPAIYARREHAEAGGLMSYAPNLPDQSRQAGVYVGRILKGEKPADLPVVQPTKFEFLINLQTAEVLGITVPPGLLAIADEVIE
jgi:putative ABC transport system substrate-binding protein